MLQQTFFQKFMLMILSGLAAACLLWGIRHIVRQSFWETGDGWKESLYSKTPGPKPVQRTR
jgi:hypothetical protein